MIPSTAHKLTTLPPEQAIKNPEINALITMRLVQFYRQLVVGGLIKPLSTDGPNS